MIDPTPARAFGTPVCRLGLATRGDSDLTVDDVNHAIGRGVNFLNNPGIDDPVSRAVAGLGRDRERVVVCIQFEARTALDAATELRRLLAAFRTDYLDVLTFYYVERPEEWAEVLGPGGAWEYLSAARRD